MADEDLTKLKIDKSGPSLRPRKGRKALYGIVGLAALILLVILFLTGIFSPAIHVETGSVAQIYPSQTVTLLNASGYVVPQRKAAAASKVTGRLVALHVEEGSRVKKGQVIAQLENDDIVASRKQALANLDVSRSGLAGIFFASFMQLFTISTVNFQTFSELAFQFALTLDISWKAIAFSLIMGLVGGILPAIRAAHMKIVDALRAK